MMDNIWKYIFYKDWFIKMSGMLINHNKINTTEEFLLKENTRLMIENIVLKNELKSKEIGLDLEEMEEQYREYYVDESGEII
jgi:predicted patatin/cPLA2 family phospholipase